MRVILGFNEKPKDFYVYLHRRLDTMEVFYVGKGSKDRAWVMHGRIKHNRSHWANIARKYGVYVEIVQDCLQEWAALELEIGLIAYYGRSDLKLGNLVNKTDGGESGLGIIFTEDTRAKLKQAQLKYGKRLTINNHVSFLTIKDAAKYLLGEGKTDSEYRVVCSAISSCLCKRIKTYKGNLIYHTHEDYLSVKKEAGKCFKVKHSDEIMISRYQQYMRGERTMISISRELGLDESYLQRVFKGEYRSHLGFKQKPPEDRLKFNNSEIANDLESMTAIQVMQKYNISKTHLYRVKNSNNPTNQTLDKLNNK